MKQGFSKLFQALPEAHPPKGLEGKIILTLRAKEKHAARVRFGFLSTLSFASLGGIVSLATSLFQSFSTSGFSHYFSLIFSENIALTGVWKEFALSLIDSLPVVGLIAFFAASAVFVWSLARASRSVKGAFYQFN